MFKCLHVYLPPSVHSRAQSSFRQAMASSVILFHVVPASMKRQYELLSLSNLSPQQSNRVRFRQDCPQPGDRSSVVSRSGSQSSQTHKCVSLYSFSTQTESVVKKQVQVTNVWLFILSSHQSPLAGSTPEPKRRYATLPRTSATPPSLQRRVSANPSPSSCVKKKGHRFTIQLKKGEKLRHTLVRVRSLRA